MVTIVGGPQKVEHDEQRDTPGRCSQFLLPGNIIGSYRIIKGLGEGGMGRVYHAEHARLGRSVAIKVLHQEYLDKPELVRRFFAEARAANQIDHENILEITDFVEEKSTGLYFIVMEHLRGLDLLALLQREGALPPLRSVLITKQIASALAAAHAAAIVHRDLKPENVFLIERTGRKDFVKLLDFGVAKLLEGQDVSPLGISVNETSPGTMIGTPTYMSPEQACGRPVDHRSDIYSFGVILYELITGRVPFEGHSFGELVVKHTVMAPPKPSQRADLTHPVPQRLERLILKCLEKEVDQRPQSMDEVFDELDEIGAAIASPPEWVDSTPPVMDSSAPSTSSSVDEPPPAPRRRRIAIAVAGLALVALIAVVTTSVGDEADSSGPTGGESPATQGAAVSPATPTSVSLTFESVPSGATLYDSTNGAAIGRTPMTKSFEQADRLQTFELRRPGYQPAQAEVSLARDSRLTLTLEPIETPADAGAVEPEAAPAPQRRRRASTRSTRDASPPQPTATSPAPASSSPRQLGRRGVIDPFAID